MNASLEDFLLHARQVLERLEPLLPHRREPLDWQHCYAARWRREGHGGYLQPLEVNPVSYTHLTLPTICSV